MLKFLIVITLLFPSKLAKFVVSKGVKFSRTISFIKIKFVEAY